jgi:Holliday junction resolvase RusA-like endonuclease
MLSYGVLSGRKSIVRIVTFTILGEPASKANSRKAVMFGKRPAFIKSDKARNYVAAFEAQCPKLEVPFDTDVRVEMLIYYATRRPDLDESLILDCMQGPIYLNDRQVKQKMIYWGLDRANPRTVIRVSAVEEIPSHLILKSEDDY